MFGKRGGGVVRASRLAQRPGFAGFFDTVRAIGLRAFAQDIVHQTRTVVA
jgi:hypothetical protein